MREILMWLATVTENLKDRIAYLKRALTLEPTNEDARKAYVRLAEGSDIDFGAGA